MEFKTLAVLIITIVVLFILITLVINLSGVLSSQASNATSLLRW